MKFPKNFEKVLKLKTSNAKSAELLGITVSEYKNFRSAWKTGDAKVKEQRVNLDKGTATYTAEMNTEPLSDEEIIQKFKINTDKYKLSGYWSKEQPGGKYFVSANVTLKKEEEKQLQEFMEFLKTYKPKTFGPAYVPPFSPKTPGALIINAQDAHWNKFDTDYNNNITERFEKYDTALKDTIAIASSQVSLGGIAYIIGSDCFNSEVTGATVKGTTQVNILTYHKSFELVCNHEVHVIRRLLQSAEQVTVYYLVGNHDATVSYHMVSWLKAYFKEEKRLTINIGTDFTKYFSLYDTAVCINHGDVQKPERLAQNFPLEYREGFYKADHHIILTGDKHTELTRDIGGITFYQIPALSTAKGSWDKQMGYTTTKSKMTSFLIEKGQGVSNVIKRVIK